MAKIRSIKPEFFTSTQLVECSVNARFMFIGMWCFADDSGIHPADARRVKLEIFPGDDCTSRDIRAWADELVATGLLEEYSACGNKWWRVTGWLKHQKIDQPTYRHPLPDGTTPESPLRRWKKGNTPYVHRIDGVHTQQERNGTDGSGTDTVRPFVAADHSDDWPEARRRAAATAKRLWTKGRPKPSSKAELEKLQSDDAMLLKLAFLSVSLFSDGWLTDAIGGATQRTVKKPIAYLKKILSTTALSRGHNLNELLDGIDIPPKPMALTTDASLVPDMGVPPDTPSQTKEWR